MKKVNFLTVKVRKCNIHVTFAVASQLSVASIPFVKYPMKCQTQTKKIICTWVYVKTIYNTNTNISLATEKHVMTLKRR